MSNDFATWVFGLLASELESEDSDFLGIPDKGSKSFYLWSVAERDRLLRDNSADFDHVPHFRDYNHLHLIKTSAGDDITVVFTHRKNVEASPFGDNKERRQAEKSAKEVRSIKQHPGGFSDTEGRNCLLASNVQAEELATIWSDVPAWQLTLFQDLRKLVAAQLRESREVAGFDAWWDRWTELMHT